MYGYGSIILEVLPNGDASCRTNTVEGLVGAVHLTELQAMGVLFGPRAPWATVELPVEASLLAAWCPLPLYISHQHGI